MKKIFLVLIVIVIIISIGVAAIFCRNNEKDMNKTENSDLLNQDRISEIDYSNAIDYGIITNIKNDSITVKNENSYEIKLDKNTKLKNLRTAEAIDLSDIKIGDYYKSGEIIRNISGDEWERECIKNLANCYREGHLICNPQKVMNVENMGDYVLITLLMTDSTTAYFNEEGSKNNTFVLKAIAYSNLKIPTSSGEVTVYNLKEEVNGFMFWIGLDKNTIDNKYPVISNIEIYDK